MIEETATVVKATPDFIWVEVATRTACASCGSKSDCATSSISKLFGTRRQQLRFANSTASKVGDKVIYKKWGGNEFKIGDTEYQFLKFEDILAVIK